MMTDPHANTDFAHSGPCPPHASVVLVLLHGRGATADSMMPLAELMDVPELCALAPQAAGHTWYPLSFLAPLPQNQPYLDSAIARVERLVADVLQVGVAASRLAILGFSQGACLACEFAARHPRRYGAVMALTGGLIGPPGTQRNYPGRLDGVNVFLGASDPDPHVPFTRVSESADVLRAMGASVDLRRYPGLPHTISQEQLDVCRTLVRAIAQ